MSHRVRTLIQHMSYKELRKAKHLPKKPLFTGIKRGGYFPSTAKKIGYPQFGLFLDKYIQKVLAAIHGLEYEHTYTSTYKLYVKCVTHFFGDTPIEKEIFKENKDYYTDISDFIQEEFSDAEHIDLEPEWIAENVAGHPEPGHRWYRLRYQDYRSVWHNAYQHYLSSSGLLLPGSDPQQGHHTCWTCSSCTA